jgi:outer membrane immunogenic protein
MKKLLLGSVALAAMIAGPAMAADMPLKAPPPVVTYYDWSGYYIGFSIGGMWSTVDRTFPNPAGLGGFGPGPAGNFSTNRSDAVYDIHVGTQWQWNQWVLGVEAAYTGCFRECTSLSGVLPVAAAGAPPLFTPNTIGQHKITNLFTAGPRLGYAWDRLLVYGTGGIAEAALKGTYCLTTGPGGSPQCNLSIQNGQSTNWGWYAGGGFEYMIAKGALVDVIAGVEYQHFDVGTVHATPAFAATGADYNLAAHGDTVRGRLTIKWNPYPAAAVFAKY